MKTKLINLYKNMSIAHPFLVRKGFFLLSVVFSGKNSFFADCFFFLRRVF